MPGGGTIEVACCNLAKGSLPGELPLAQKEYVRITLSDNGLGMPDEVLGKIFDPYYSTKKEGSGLGLVITLSIVKKHKGDISVSSKPR